MNKFLDYVAGFAFNEDMTKVIMVKKEKPNWQKGKINAVGGKVNGHEFYPTAMSREFLEETGIETTFEEWNDVIAIKGKDFKVVFYMTKLDDERFHSAQSMEEEEILILNVMDVKLYDRIDNIDMLLDMCYYKERTGFVFE